MQDSKNARLARHLDELDRRIDALEARLRTGGDQSLADVLAEGLDIVGGLLGAYAEHAGKPLPVSDDLLEVFKAFVKGDPSLNAVRDNIRELVYYQNCLVLDRADALPRSPERMVAHTARHIYLYLRSRAEQEHRLD